MMTSEKEIISSLLRLSKTGSVQRRLIEKDARVSTEVIGDMLRRLSETGLLSQHCDLVEVSPSQRVSLAVRALKLGADYEQICKFLSWIEFEGITAQVFEANRFWVLKNFRFKHANKRWEMDVVSCREPLVVCIDCKHWQHGWSRAAIINAVEAQTERTRAFADALPNYHQKVAKLAKWKSATLIPLILSLIPGPFKFHSKVPVVPVLQLRDFINEMPLELDSLTHFTKKCLRFNQELTNYYK